MVSRGTTLTVLWMTCTLMGCGGAQSPDAETPTEETSASEEPAGMDDEASASSDTETEGGEGDQEKSEKAGGSGSSSKETAAKPTRSPKDLITAENTMFSFSFKDSEAYQKAEERCDKKAGGDPEKKASCMEKEGDKIGGGDSMIFHKEPDGTWTWITLRRSGAKTTVLHKFEVEFGEETDKTIIIKPKGRDKGTKPMPPPAQVLIEVTDMGITLNDPKLGKMVYVSKLGTVGDAGR